MFWGIQHTLRECDSSAHDTQSCGHPSGVLALGYPPMDLFESPWCGTTGNSCHKYLWVIVWAQGRRGAENNGALFIFLSASLCLRASALKRLKNDITETAKPRSPYWTQNLNEFWRQKIRHFLKFVSAHPRPYLLRKEPIRLYGDA
jgi:hypothetical protein